MTFTTNAGNFATTATVATFRFTPHCDCCGKAMPSVVAYSPGWAPAFCMRRSCRALRWLARKLP